jgi:hypothetical protein
MPIGQENTDEWKMNMAVFEKVIKPCVENGPYQISCIHSALIGIPGSIPEQIITALKGDDIVVADLRGQNPNVIWELGVRHASLKRSIMICSDYSQTFFDTHIYRVAKYNVNGDSNQDFYNKISGFIKDIIENPTRPDNPIMHYQINVGANNGQQLSKCASDVLRVYAEQQTSNLLEEFVKVKLGDSYSPLHVEAAYDELYRKEFLLLSVRNHRGTQRKLSGRGRQFIVNDLK